jgi:tRNA threonylcarbamoyladenosine modification (KEOPS) complex Cgi121 subunit
MDRNAIEAIIGLTNEFTQQYDLALQFFRRDSISGEEHVLSALLHALRAEAEERSRTRETSLDVLRYAAGERQIRSAIASTGLQIGLITYLCMVFIPAEGQPDVGNTTIRDTAFAFLRGIGFEITDMHPSCQGALLASLERTALVDLKL